MKHSLLKGDSVKGIGRCSSRGTGISGCLKLRSAAELGLVKPRVAAELGLVKPRVAAELGLAKPRDAAELGLAKPRVAAELGTVKPRVAAELSVCPASGSWAQPVLRVAVRCASAFRHSSRADPDRSQPRLPESGLSYQDL